MLRIRWVCCRVGCREVRRSPESRRIQRYVKICLIHSSDLLVLTFFLHNVAMNSWYHCMLAPRLVVLCLDVSLFERQFEAQSLCKWLVSIRYYFNSFLLDVWPNSWTRQNPEPWNDYENKHYKVRIMFYLTLLALLYMTLIITLALNCQLYYPIYRKLENHRPKF